MEFSRRGPATDRTDDGHHFVDLPPQGDPMLVIRDALLSQLQKDRLRQEIIVAELTKIERTMALRSVADGRQASPMPASECLTPCVSKAAQQNAAPDEQRLQDSNEVPPSKTPPAEKWELTGITIPVKKPKPPMKWNCSVCQVQATSEQNLQLHYAGQKHLSNVATQDPTTKASGQKAETEAEPSLGTEEKKTSSIKWSCTTCQANGICQSTLEAHLKGRKHQKLKTAAEPTLGGEEKKTSSIKWSCSTCQASGTCHSTLESHLKGRRHQQNIAATSTEGDKNGMPKNVTAHEAKPHSMATTDDGQSKAGPFRAEQPMAQQNAEFDDRKLPDCNQVAFNSSLRKLKPPMKWNCTVCQVQATCEQNLQQHYAGQKHLSNIATLDSTTKASYQKAKTAAEPSLGTEEKKTSSIKWSCNTCQANGTSQSTFEAHLKGKRHQQKIVAAVSMEGDKNGIPKNVVAQETESHSINVPKQLEKPPSSWIICSICQVVCTCQTDLKNHLRGIRHGEKVQSLFEQSKNKASDSESRKSKLIPDSRWICSICDTHCTCESDLENHLAGRRHQLNIQVVREKIKEEKNNPPQIAKNQEPSSEWNCAMCEVKCNSESQFEVHYRSSRHQQKIQAILANIAKGSSSSRTKSEAPSDGSNSKNASSEKAVKQLTVYFCEICNLLCESSTALVHHRYGKKHRAKLSARSELS